MRNVGSISDDVIFSAELFPYRSLGKRGLRNLFLVVLALAAIHVLFFAVTGTWIVLLFWGVDFLLLYAAFWFSNRELRRREFVSVTPMEVLVRKRSAWGREQKFTFNPFSAHFDISRRGEFGIEAMRLRGRGVVTELGSFLNPDDRESFAKAFDMALKVAKSKSWR